MFAITPGATIDIGGFGEVLPRYENYVDIDPLTEGRLGHSGTSL